MRRMRAKNHNYHLDLVLHTVPVPLILRLKAVGSLVPAQLEAVMLAS